MEKNKICLNNITQGGVACKNPTITWTNAEDTCLLINCIDDNCVIVQVPEDCEERCVTFILDCQDCDQCPPVIITRCLCDSNEDCGNCENCVNGFCTPKECPGQVCDPATGDCVNCIDDENCPCNQVCIANNCQCADPSQFINDKGCCVDCLDDEDCPECHVCVGGTCVPVVCPDGVCNPDTRTCVECLTAGDCTGDNECCIGSRCACCPGYYRDPNGDCVEIPECNSDDDCPECFVCVGGDCVPQVCPAGKVCVDGDCVDECDCYNPQCSGGRACLPHYSGTCYCVDCKGSCSTQNDCGEGCLCVNGQCVTNPCSGLCVTGSDCGPGCGCVNGRCQPCSTFNCADCAIVNGCDCIGGTCVDSPCDSPCVDGRDCAFGCGCRNNNCVACESVSCATNANCPEGCYCDGGTCKANPCAEVFCSSPNDCGQGCGCFDGECAPCSSRSCLNQECDTTPGCICVNGNCVDDNKDCEDVLKLERNNSNCTLIASLDSKACCQCDDIEARITTTYTTSSTAAYSVGIDLYKNGVQLDASPNIAEDLPISGSFEVKLTQTFREVNSVSGNFIPNGSTATLTMTKTQNVSTTTSLTTITFADQYQGIPLPLPNSTVLINNKTYRISTRSITVRTLNNINIVNECSYSFALATIYSRGSYQVNPPSNGATYNFTRRLTRLVNCRRPLFVLYEATSVAGLSNPSNVIKRGYAPKVSGKYQITYTVSDGIEYGKYYRLYTPCGCKNSTVYSCNNNETATPLVFCNPTNVLDYTISNCGKTLTFNSNVTITCPVYLNGTSKPVYGLYINGALAATRTLGTAPATSSAVFLTGDAFTVSTCITQVELKIVGDVCENCNILQNNACQELDIEILSVTNDCSNPNVGQLTFSVNGGLTDYDWSVTETGDSGTVTTPGTHTVSIDLSAYNSNKITLVITDDSGGGCTESVEVPFTKVQSIVNFVVGFSCFNGIPTLNVSGTYFQSAVTVTATNGNTFLSSVVGPGLLNTSFQLPNGGIWNVVATSNLYPNCTASRNISINCCNPNPFANTSVAYSCSTGLSISNAPSGATFTVNGQTVNNGSTFANGSYTLLGTLGTCTITLPFTVNCAPPPCVPTQICAYPPSDAVVTSLIVNGTTTITLSPALPILVGGLANINFVNEVAARLAQTGFLPCGNVNNPVQVLPVGLAATNTWIFVVSAATSIQMFYNNGASSITLNTAGCPV